ncbi:MAG: prepilin-type N-terminal cleavage/methylation domain-containing protein, partial [Alphaproteobacteria bacterium]|nr:prepilin-type N-terminal cleavage/methylation domain-containing protein [Alphaproteobacteria bacterium]
MIRGSRAFTLIELAIVLVIISLVTAGGVNFLVSMLERQHIDESNARLDYIQQMLQNYLNSHDALPCPSDPKLPSTDPNFGVANCAAAGLAKDGANTAEGMLPYKTMKIDPEFAESPWKNGYLFYAVDKRMTVLGVKELYASGSTIPGSITVNDDKGNPRTTQALYALVN